MASREERDDATIRSLVADLQPVKRLWPPGLRALLWIAAVVAAAVALAMHAELSQVRARLMGAPDMWLAACGSALTTILAAVSAFQVGLPDRSPAWSLLPLPAALLWLGASGLGCLRAWTLPDVEPATVTQEKDCFWFIVVVSAPLSALLLMMLRRGRPLRPGLAALLGGLSAAAAAATLLLFFHPFDASGTDIAVHVFAVTVVVATNRLLGGRLLGSANRSMPLGA